MITKDNFTRTTSDINGNPRYIIDWLSLGLEKYEANKQTREAGLSKYRGKSYGGGFVIQSYNLDHTANWLNKIFYPRKKRSKRSKRSKCLNCNPTGAKIIKSDCLTCGGRGWL